MLTRLTMYATTSPAGGYDLKGGAVWLKGFALLCVLVILVFLTGKALLKHGQSGDISKSWSMLVATLICLTPLALIGGIGVITGTGGAMLATVTKILS